MTDMTDKEEASLHKSHAEAQDRIVKLEAEVAKERARSHDFENENRRLRTALSSAGRAALAEENPK